jgi:hypothetical protein
LDMGSRATRLIQSSEADDVRRTINPSTMRVPSQDEDQTDVDAGDDQARRVIRRQNHNPCSQTAKKTGVGSATVGAGVWEVERCSEIAHGR